MIPYTPTKLRSEYEAALGGDPKKISDFNKVWNFVRTIPISKYEDSYNKLEGTRNIPALDILNSNVQTAISSVEAEKLTYKDIAVQAPLNDLLIRLRNVENEIGKEKRAFAPSSSSTGFMKVINAVRPRVRQAQDAYSKFSKPGRDVYNFAERLFDSGGSSLFHRKGK